MQMNTPGIGLCKDFMESFSKLPKTIQKKTREFLDKFQDTPTRSGLNFERIEGAADPKVRSVRIDQTYRAIVIHPPKGDVFMLAWVDHHDDAYQWVKNRKFEVNPSTGAFQVYQLLDVEEGEASSTPRDDKTYQPAGLFATHDDEDLVLLGVPSVLLPAVREVRAERMLDDLAAYLPEEAAEGLYALAAGLGLDEALEQVTAPKPKPASVDTEDFATAMEHPVSQRQIKMVEGEDDLTAMLDAPMALWRVFLHPTQRKLVEVAANGPYRVLGGAGTGKTVVLLHRARHLARKLRGESDRDGRILVTTYTRNLAGDLAENLRELCGDEFEQLEVVNLHSWAAQYLRKQGVQLSMANEELQREFMEQAVAECDSLKKSARFYRDEWVHVVQPQDVLKREDYFRARRVGRGTPLGRRQRDAVWQVLSRYREQLAEAGKMEWADAVREARLFIKDKNVVLPYRALLADEVQDFSAGDLRLVRTIVPEGADDLFLVGDGHQRIYGQPTSLSSCGIRVVGRSRRLKLNYRTTDAIAKHSLAILRDCEIDDLDEGIDTLQGYTSLRKGIAPCRRQFDSAEAEGKFVVEQVQAWLDSDRPAEQICIGVRVRKDARGRYRQLLEAAGIPSTVLEKDSETKASGVRIATMHRMKGLEFPCVLLASVHAGVVPHIMVGTHEDRLLQERCLFYVASTRARDELVVTGYGKPSPFLGNRY